MFKFVAPRFIFKVERWKWNDEYRIYVSNMGHFMDEHKKIIPIKIAEGGYVGILTNYGWAFAHRLVMKTWRPTANMENLTVDHLDHNKRNNSVENLEWVTRAENLARAKADYIPCLVKQKKKATVVNAKLNRYKRTNYTMDDLILFVNGIECSSVEKAYEIGRVEIWEKHPKKAKAICADHYVIEAIKNRYDALLNRCNHKDVNVIDGKEGTDCFKFLKLTVKVKPQEDE